MDGGASKQTCPQPCALSCLPLSWFFFPKVSKQKTPFCAPTGLQGKAKTSKEDFVGKIKESQNQFHSLSLAAPRSATARGNGGTWEEPGPSLLSHQPKEGVQSEVWDSHHRLRGPRLNHRGTVAHHRTAVLETHSVGCGRRAPGTAGRAHHSQPHHFHLCSLPPGHSASPEECILHCRTGTQRGRRPTLRWVHWLDQWEWILGSPGPAYPHLSSGATLWFQHP